MATALEVKEASKTLQGIDNNRVQIDHLDDGRLAIYILPQKEVKTEENSGKSKWAKIAEKMAKENLLKDGLGDELREYFREFRQNFVMKDPFDIEKKKG